MRRLLSDDDEFEPVGPHGLVDTEIERIIRDRAGLLYPDFFVIPVRINFKTEFGVVHPHLVFVHRSYGEWWFVTIEPGAPPSSSQVAEQVKRLRHCTYDAEFVQTICARESNIVEASLRQMVGKISPGLFVLIGIPPAPEVDDAGVRVGVLEAFKSKKTGRSMLRINGVHPTAPEIELTTCVRDPFFPTPTFRVVDPSKLEAWAGDQKEVEFGDGLSVWSKRTTKTDVLLLPVGLCTLPTGTKSFRLMQSSSGRLRIAV